ncbi:DUF2589 domain-containing protein [Gallaecimonas kandeliae]|uniref:DUF2589 domain-containing protein n=1 Tax=Gallaecimonas kandeliae TaxID=3029055 RepID=UPI002649CE48|nr:DUF2589 domain-containing protein [Gallaecimonas kandeliae]WKE64078.1 DUF2589 domain-containing protein [Gallaecimonas kandeliae]
MTLQDLVEAIMTSVANAQDEIEKQNLLNISQYFDGDGNPEVVRVRVPQQGLHLVDEGEGNLAKDRVVEVPLLSLLQINPIKIKEMTVDFDVSLEMVGKVEEVAAKEQAVPKNNLLDTTSSNSLRGRARKRLMATELFSGSLFGGSKNRNAKVKITFESGEPPEGYIKLNSHLLKLF